MRATGTLNFLKIARAPRPHRSAKRLRVENDDRTPERARSAPASVVESPVAGGMRPRERRGVPQGRSPAALGDRQTITIGPGAESIAVSFSRPETGFDMMASRSAGFESSSSCRSRCGFLADPVKSRHRRGRKCRHEQGRTSKTEIAGRPRRTGERPGVSICTAAALAEARRWDGGQCRNSPCCHWRGGAVRRPGGDADPAHTARRGGVAGGCVWSPVCVPAVQRRSWRR